MDHQQEEDHQEGQQLGIGGGMELLAEAAAEQQQDHPSPRRGGANVQQHMYMGEEEEAMDGIPPPWKKHQSGVVEPRRGLLPLPGVEPTRGRLLPRGRLSVSSPLFSPVRRRPLSTGGGTGGGSPRGDHEQPGLTTRTAPWSGGKRLESTAAHVSAARAAEAREVPAKRPRGVSPPRFRYPPTPQDRRRQQAEVAAEVVFPTAPPVVILTVAQASGPYAMSDPTQAFKAEIAAYEAWCGSPINTERSRRYIKAAQSTSLAKTQTMVLAFAGIIQSYYAIDRDEVTLAIYANPTFIARLVGFLQVGGSSLTH